MKGGNEERRKGGNKEGSEAEVNTAQEGDNTPNLMNK